MSGSVRRRLKAMIFWQLSILLISQGNFYAQATLCSGNLGTNIFTSGDFGTGAAVVFPNDPGLAPGFIYTQQMPPDDGEYTLTNDMAKWNSSFPTWIRIGDNSPDPKGYMMVVNASFSPGIFYDKIIDNLCDNTLYEFSADIINLIETGTPGHIFPNVSFLINNTEVYSTGQIPQDEKWHTYGFTFTSGPGQNSIKLTLRNNAPGGTGNDLAIDNISFRACGPPSSISISPEGRICENSLFPILTAHIDADTGALQWQTSIDTGLTWTNIISAVDKTYQINILSAGVYYFRYLYSTSLSNLTNSNCRIVSDTIRVEIVPVEFLIEKTICEGLTFNLGGIEYGTTGIYQDHLIASNGCDSLVTLDLMIVPDPPIVAEFTFTPTSCEGADDGSISLLSVSGTRPPFIFRINDSIVPAPSTSIMLSAGTYTAWILDEYGCYDNAEIIVPDGPPMDIHTIEDTTIILGHSVLLNTTSNLPVWLSTWNPPEGLLCSNCLSTLASPFEEMTYVITAQTASGCEDVDSVTIRVDRDPVLYIPNVFSPDHDGINDFFEITSDPLNVTSIDLVIIFDRWGGIMSEKANLYNEGNIKLWDGNTPVGSVNPGVYVYLIKFTMADGTRRNAKGDVTVVK
ncbi:MAG TPA: gliding motility-associated C-terminal domain-containing protein [Saprospiraceae bacterium]|nr:gliding motility-associated C-terminal domain-containing protein [Saprospiraceae bacterium]